MVSQRRTEGNKVVIKAFRVEKILNEKIGRDQVNFKENDFPGVSKDVLIQVGKVLPRKYLDILIGNSNLGLQPVCNFGFGCKNCLKGRCLYRSRFGQGYVPLGYFQESQSIINVIRHVALTKIAPILDGQFFQAEQLGIGPIERCTTCKLRISECRVCSSESAHLTAQEEEEYSI